MSTVIVPGPSFTIQVVSTTVSGTGSSGSAGGSIPPPNLSGVVASPPLQPPVPAGAPGQVQGLTASYPNGLNNFPVTLSWQPVAGASYYRLHMLYDAESIGAAYGLANDPSQVDGTWGYYWNITGTSAQITQPGGSMLFEVTACNALGCGLWSARVQVVYIKQPPPGGPDDQ